MATGNPHLSEDDFPLEFSEWLKSRRQALDLTQTELARQVSCSVFAVRKMEAGDRRPSRQLAGLLAQVLRIPPEDQATFIKVARGELNPERLPSPSLEPLLSHDTQPSPAPSNLPRTLTPFIGREPELTALGQLLSDPRCSMLTIVGLGGIGKTRLAIELASHQKTSFPGGVYYASLDSIDSPDFIVPAIAQAFGLSFSGGDDPQDQLLSYLAHRDGQAFLLLIDNLEQLLVHASDPGSTEEVFVLLPQLLEKAPGLKILTTSRERINVREEWVFELHGLPVPGSDETDRWEDYSAVALFLQRARQVKADFQALLEQRPDLVRICQLVEGTPLAIELAAAWVPMLSLKEISQEIASNLDFLSITMRDIPERHRSLRAVFAHSWKLLSDEERNVLCRLAVFRGGFQRQAAEQVAGASLPILMSLLSKSLLERREDGHYDLHELIRQCAMEKLRESGDFDAACSQHLAYYVAFTLEAHQGLRSAQQPDWLRQIEQEHNNIRAALEWAFAPATPSERVDEGFSLVSSIDRYWIARGHVYEGITWLERGLEANHTVSLARARGLRTAGVLYNVLYNHGDVVQPSIRLLQESLAIARQLNDEICQANALDTLGDVAARFGDFLKAKAYFVESLALFRKIGDPRSIGLSLATLGRLHGDHGYCQEAEQLLTEGLSFLDRVSDLRGQAYCLHALGRVAISQGDLKLAVFQFRQALRLNYRMGWLLDLSELLREIAVVEAISGNPGRATLLLAASTVLMKKIGYHFPVNDLVDRLAPAGWLNAAPLSKEWQEGEKMSPDQAVAYALEREIE